MVILTFVLATALTWAVWFTLMLIPAYGICKRWVPVPQLNPHPVAYAGLVMIFGVYSQLAVMVVTIGLMLSEFFILGPSPSGMLELQRFVIPATTALFFPPTFAALIVGYRRLRREMFGGDDGLATT